MTFVGPGDIITTDNNGLPSVAGTGCYKLSKSNIIRSSVYGNVSVLESKDNENNNHNIVRVIPLITSEPIIKQGDIVYCKVQKVFLNQVSVEIMTVGDKLLVDDSCPKGIIKREDTCSNSLDVSIPMYDFFRPKDIVRAEVISLGDARQYILKTNSNDLGVIKAQSNSGNSWLVVINDKVREINLND